MQARSSAERRTGVGKLAGGVENIFNYFKILKDIGEELQRGMCLRREHEAL